MARIRLYAATSSLVLGCLLLVGPPASPAAAAPASARVAGCTTHKALGRWSLRQLAWQTVVVPADETNVSAVGDLVANGAGGVILFGNHAPSDLGAQLAKVTARAPKGLEPFVMTDEEGGSVQRMANLVGSMPSARTMGATMTADEIRQLAHQVGTKMAAAGITMDLAPVLDLDAGPGPNANNPIGTRSFSADEAVAGRDGLAFAQGLTDGGVVPVVKHFPGLGGATGNTDTGAASTKPWSVLQKHDLKPYAAAVRAGVPVVMTSNAKVPGLSSAPASLSHTVTTNVLRRRLGFDGLVITDSLSTGAIADAGYHVPGASVRAIEVGADMVIYTAAAGQVGAVAKATVSAMVAAAQTGRLPRRRLESAVAHGLTARGIDPCAGRG